MQVLLDLVPCTTHTALGLATEIVRSLIEFGLSLEKLIAVVADNASANKKCVELLNVEKEREYFNSPKISAVYCFAHSVHRIVLQTIAVLEPAVATIHVAIIKLRNSPQFNEKLLEQIRLLNQVHGEESQLPEILPVLYCRTRWNSMILMLRTILRIRPAIQSLSRKYPSTFPAIEQSIWSAIRTFLTNSNRNNCSFFIQN